MMDQIELFKKIDEAAEAPFFFKVGTVKHYETGDTFVCGFDPSSMGSEEITAYPPDVFESIYRSMTPEEIKEQAEQMMSSGCEGCEGCGDSCDCGGSCSCQTEQQLSL